MSSAAQAVTQSTAATTQALLDDAATAVKAGKAQPITSSPQIVENTLKEFYEYLQFLKDKLQQHQQQQRQYRRQNRHQRNNSSSGESSSGDDSGLFDESNLNCKDLTEEEEGILNNHNWSQKTTGTRRQNDISSSEESTSSDSNGFVDNDKRVSASENVDPESQWTFERDTKRYLQHLTKYKNKILEQIDRFPLHSQAGREILEAIQSATPRGNAQQLAQPKDVLRHVRQMALYVSRLLQEIQLVDLDLLIKYMSHNQHAGNVMAGKDVMLLCGAARAGKTTTLHFLAGSRLEEVEVDGFFHLQPTAVKDRSLAEYSTGSSANMMMAAGISGREAVTTHLQTAEVQLGEETVVICDTPGLGPHDDGLSNQSVEWDIANGLGMIRAIHRAKTVKPVWVINRDEVSFRERFTSSALDGETVAAMRRLMSKSPEPMDLSPFNYVFTKYEQKHREVLCRQFAVMRKNYSILSSKERGAYAAKEVQSVVSCSNTAHKDDHSHTTGANCTVATGATNASRDTHGSQSNANRRWMRKVLDDITKKTTPQANIVLPLQDDPELFLQHLWDDCRTVNEPKRFFVPFVSYPALKKLQLQLRITLSDLRTSLVEEDQTTAVYRLRQLQRLAQVLPEATDCANLGVEAVKKHMMGLRSRVLASIERKDYSMAIHRAQQLVTLSDVLPEAKTYGTITHDAVILLRDLISALQATDYKMCQDRMTKLSELAREFPEANKCAHFALQASIGHVTEFRDRVIKLIDNLLDLNSNNTSKEGTKRFTAMLEELNSELSKVVASEPLLLLCVKEDYIGLDVKEERSMKNLARHTSEAFCIDQVQRLTDHVQRDVPNFQSNALNRDDLLKRREVVLTALERLKIICVCLTKSPAGARADSIYHQAFKSFHDLVSSILTEAEHKYKSSWTDLDTFGRKVWFVAVLLQGPLKSKPHTARREHAKIEDLERRVLKLMLRLEIEVKRSIDKLKNFKFPDCSSKAFLKHTPIPDVGIIELKAPRFLLISVAKNARIRKLLPSKMDVLEVNVCIAMFDHALLAFWHKMVIRLEQDYAVVVAMQKTKKDPQEILQVAKQLRTDISRVEKEFLDVCGWSDDITNESEADLKRLIAVRDCVHMGVTKMEDTAKAKARGMSFFACGNLDTVDNTNSSCISCRPTVPATNKGGNIVVLGQPKAAPE